MEEKIATTIQNFIKNNSKKIEKVFRLAYFYFLIIFGVYGVWAWLIGYTNVLYLSFLTDMFLFYSWQRKKKR